MTKENDDYKPGEALGKISRETFGRRTQGLSFSSTACCIADLSGMQAWGHSCTTSSPAPAVARSEQRRYAKALQHAPPRVCNHVNAEE